MLELTEAIYPKDTDEYIQGMIRLSGNMSAEQSKQIVDLWVKKVRKPLTKGLVVMEAPKECKKPNTWEMPFRINNAENFYYMTDVERRDKMSSSMYELLKVLTANHIIYWRAPV